MPLTRRSVLQILTGATASLVARRPLWALGTTPSDEFFIFIHAAGGWDVTLWSDPRNERKGLVDPASTANTDTLPLKRWKSAPLDGGTRTFEILAPPDSDLRFGPAIGDLYDLRDRLTIINGIEMSTVSHPDGIAYSITGRHLAGGKPTQSSADLVIASERGASQLVPSVSVAFPSSFVGDALDRRALPLRMGNVATFARSLSRSDASLSTDDRAAITAVLSDEARELAQRSNFEETYQRLGAQYAAQTELVSREFGKAFEATALQSRYPMFGYPNRSHGAATLAAPFAIEALRRNLVRCVAFSLGGLDTHNENYKKHATILQDLFGTVATLLQQLDQTPHPTKSNAKLSEHTHLFVFSDFCRTPQITISGGRDHYPNNSALIISPKFRGGRIFGETDQEQLLPRRSDGHTISPSDVLATILHAHRIEPGSHLSEYRLQKQMLVE